MNTLDNPKMIDPSTVPYAKKAFNQGLIGAMILIAIGLVFNVTGLVEPGDAGAIVWMTYLINLGILSYFIYAAANNHKMNDLGGYISYGRAFATGAVVVLGIVLVLAIWTYVYASFIDPSMQDTIREASIENMINQQGMSEEQAEDIATNSGFFNFMISPVGSSISTGFIILFFGLIIDLIVAAVVKKDDPAFAS